MKKTLRGKLTYANVVSTLCLFLLLGGSALAAKHYLITSTSQISPKVLKKLTGQAGAAGTNGAPGAPGARGEAGIAGTDNVLTLASSGALHSGSEQPHPHEVAGTSFTVAGSAEVLLQGSGEMLASCPTPGSNECPTSAALYVDGKQVSGSQIEFLSGGASNVKVVISVPLVLSVVAGTHTVELKILTALNDGGTVTNSSGSVSVVAVKPS